MPRWRRLITPRKIVGLRSTLCTSEGVLLHHVSREALAPERARRVDAYVVAEFALVYLALVHVLHLNVTLHRVLSILPLANGESLLGVRAVGHYGTRRERSLLLAFLHLDKQDFFFCFFLFLQCLFR